MSDLGWHQAAKGEHILWFHSFESLTPGGAGCLSRLLLMAVLGMALFAQPAGGKTTVTAVTPGEFPPQYSVDSSGRPQGFAVEVMDAVAALAGLEVEYEVKQDWSEAQEALKSGQADVLPNVGITERRREFLDFTSPVETFPVVIFVRSDTEAIQGREDLAGRKVAVVKINVGYTLLKNKSEVGLVLARDRQDALFKLLSGQADALVYPEPLIRLDVRRAGLEDHIKTVGEPFLEIKRAIGVASGNRELLSKLEMAVQRFVTSKSYQDIYTRWYGQPAPLLSPRRTAVGAGLLVAVCAAFFLLWRYRLQKKVAREMEDRIQERTSELRRSEELFRKVYEHMAVGVARVSRDFRIEAANEAYCHMLGYLEDELIGKHLSDITHPEILEENLRKQSQLTQGEIDHYRMEKKFIHKRGRVVHGILDANLVRDEAGQPSFFLGSVLDISERKKAEEAILESERRYRRLVDNSTEAVFLCDFSGAIIDANRVASRRLGYSFQDLLGLKAWDVDVGVSPERWFDIWGNTRLEDPKTFQGVHRRSDGSTYPVEATATMFQEDRKTYILANVRDITERKRAEEEKERLQFQLLQAQKMESVGRLAGGVAHDLNNMLVAILGYGDLLMADGELADRHRKRVQLMHQAGLRSRDLVSQLLAFSRKQTLHMENLNLNQVLVGFTKLLEKTLRENIDIQYSLSDQLPLARADRSQLEQVILNLAVNAQDAMPEGGALTIETSVVNLDESYASHHLGVTPGRYVMLVVTDTGHGMDKATQESIFDPFFTTKDVGEGTGLGLATVYGIVKQHQGNIWVYSEPAQGTVFKIYLPATDQVQSDVGQTEAADGHLTTGGLETVLVVEDDDMVRDMAVSALRDHGYTVRAAASGRDCLELLNNHENIFDLMLTDVIMPDMNGKALYEAVTRLLPDIRVLYMSGYTDNVISHHGVLDEGVDFLQKPFSVQELCLKVRKVLDD